MDKHVEVVGNTYGISAAPMTTQIFGNAGREHMEKYGEVLYLLKEKKEMTRIDFVAHFFKYTAP